MPTSRTRTVVHTTLLALSESLLSYQFLKRNCSRKSTRQAVKKFSRISMWSKSLETRLERILSRVPDTPSPRSKSNFRRWIRFLRNLLMRISKCRKIWSNSDLQTTPTLRDQSTQMRQMILSSLSILMIFDLKKLGLN